MLGPNGTLGLYRAAGEVMTKAIPLSRTANASDVTAFQAAVEELLHWIDTFSDSPNGNWMQRKRARERANVTTAIATATLRDATDGRHAARPTPG